MASKVEQGMGAAAFFRVAMVEGVKGMRQWRWLAADMGDDGEGEGLVRAVKAEEGSCFRVGENGVYSWWGCEIRGGFRALKIVLSLKMVWVFRSPQPPPPRHIDARFWNISAAALPSKTPWFVTMPIAYPPHTNSVTCTMCTITFIQL